MQNNPFLVYTMQKNLNRTFYSKKAFCIKNNTNRAIKTRETFLQKV